MIEEEGHSWQKGPSLYGEQGNSSDTRRSATLSDFENGAWKGKLYLLICKTHLPRFTYCVVHILGWSLKKTTNFFLSAHVKSICTALDIPHVSPYPDLAETYDGGDDDGPDDSAGKGDHGSHRRGKKRRRKRKKRHFSINTYPRISESICYGARHNDWQCSTVLYFSIFLYLQNGFVLPFTVAGSVRATYMQVSWTF